MRAWGGALGWVVLVLTVGGGGASSGRGAGVRYKMVRGNSSAYTVEELEVEEELEYPRYNDSSLGKVQQMWANYYSCLQEGENQETKPEIRRLLEGQHTELECDICPKPFQSSEELEWKYKPLSLDSGVQELQHLDLTREMSFAENKKLRIFNAVEAFEGLYVCYQKRNVVSVYILEVAKEDKMERVNTSGTEDEHPLTLDGTEFEIYYQWTEWTECSSCGEVGRKFKYGTCLISSVEEAPSESNDTEAAEPESSMSRRSIDFLRIQSFLKEKFFSKNSTSNDNNYQSWGVQAIDKFLTGIPCSSRYLPRAAHPHTQKYAPMKVDIRYCLEPCDRYELFEVFDANGRLIEVANNTGGIYSVLQELPQLPPDIERRSVTAEFGKDIVIQCPGTLLTTIPITWKISNEIILPDIIANMSNGRFAIDFVHRIHIKKLRLKDSNIYSCWQRKRLIGTVNLIVEKRFKVGFDHHVTLIGIIIVLVVLLLIGNKMISRELKNRKK